MSPTLDQIFFSWFSNPIPVQAFVVGMVGSAAYYIALRLGFVGGEQRKTLLKLFTPGMVFWFCVFGGSVAMVFQLAQISNFAPVQALVLGITWPVLVGQYTTAAREIENEEFIKSIRRFPRP